MRCFPGYLNIFDITVVQMFQSVRGNHTEAVTTRKVMTYCISHLSGMDSLSIGNPSDRDSISTISSSFKRSMIT